MIEVFDSYSKKTRLYYFFLIATASMVILFIITKVTSRERLEKYNLYLTILIILGFCAIVANMIISAMGLVKLYAKNGELTVSGTYININATNLTINEIKKIVIRANDYRGKRASDGSENKIIVFDESNKTYSCRFVISSINQHNNLSEIIEEWRNQGVTISDDIF